MSIFWSACRSVHLSCHNLLKMLICIFLISRVRLLIFKCNLPIQGTLGDPFYCIQPLKATMSVSPLHVEQEMDFNNFLQLLTAFDTLVCKKAILPVKAQKFVKSSSEAVKSCQKP